MPPICSFGKEIFALALHKQFAKFCLCHPRPHARIKKLQQSRSCSMALHMDGAVFVCLGNLCRGATTWGTRFMALISVGPVWSSAHRQQTMKMGPYQAQHMFFSAPYFGSALDSQGCALVPAVLIHLALPCKSVALLP